MFHIITLSHGDLAIGFESTINMFMGEVKNVDFLAFRPDQNADEFKEIVTKTFMRVPKDRPVLFLTDLYGGTPHKIATELKILFRDRVEVLSGANLPMIMSALTLNDGNLDSVAIDTIITEYNRALVRTVIDETIDAEDE